MPSGGLLYNQNGSKRCIFLWTWPFNSGQQIGERRKQGPLKKHQKFNSPPVHLPDDYGSLDSRRFLLQKGGSECCWIFSFQKELSACFSNANSRRWSFTEGFSTNVQFLTEGFTKGPLKECRSGEFNKCGASAVRWMNVAHQPWGINVAPRPDKLQIGKLAQPWIKWQTCREWMADLPNFVNKLAPRPNQ